MFIKNFKRLLISTVAAFCGIALCCGCGNKLDEGLENYKESMTEFYNKLSYYDASMNGIDASSEDAKLQLLGYLDEMNDTYKTMAALTIPEEFDGISDIAVEAADYMQMANECYHLAYDGAFDEDNEYLASQYYQRANSRARVMLQVLHGEVPTGEGVTVTTVEAGQFDTIGDESDGNQQEE
ncbi:MAG: hypothetical protein II842_01735 [Butyrivibrio sp.]|nr:hypothetical protein [Butyrivibrio sp.]